jgi:hypothetical protein
MHWSIKIVNHRWSLTQELPRKNAQQNQFLPTMIHGKNCVKPINTSTIYGVSASCHIRLICDHTKMEPAPSCGIVTIPHDCRIMTKYHIVFATLNIWSQESKIFFRPELTTTNGVITHFQTIPDLQTQL